MCCTVYRTVLIFNRFYKQHQDEKEARISAILILAFEGETYRYGEYLTILCVYSNLE